MDKHSNGSSIAPTTDAPEGLVKHWIAITADLSAATVRGLAGLAQDVRGEVSQLGTLFLDLGEASSKGSFRIARSAAQRVDGLVTEIVRGVEQGALAWVHVVKGTGREAASLAAHTARTITGPEARA